MCLVRRYAAHHGAGACVPAYHHRPSPACPDQRWRSRFPRCQQARCHAETKREGGSAVLISSLRPARLHPLALVLPVWSQGILPRGRAPSPSPSPSPLPYPAHTYQRGSHVCHADTHAADGRQQTSICGRWEADGRWMHTQEQSARCAAAAATHSDTNVT